MTTAMIDTLTTDEITAYTRLQIAQEGISVEDSSGKWATVYLDNAKPATWTGKKWAGVLSSLSKKGVYREDDGYAFGLVLMPAPVKVPLEQQMLNRLSPEVQAKVMAEVNRERVK